MAWLFSGPYPCYADSHPSIGGSFRSEGATVVFCFQPPVTWVFVEMRKPPLPSSLNETAETFPVMPALGGKKTTPEKRDLLTMQVPLTKWIIL